MVCLWLSKDSNVKSVLSFSLYMVLRIGLSGLCMEYSTATTISELRRFKYINHVIQYLHLHLGHFSQSWQTMRCLLSVSLCIKQCPWNIIWLFKGIRYIGGTGICIHTPRFPLAQLFILFFSRPQMKIWQSQLFFMQEFVGLHKINHSTEEAPVSAQVELLENQKAF